MRTTSLVFAGLLLGGCDKADDITPDLPSQADIEDAKVRVGLSADAIGNGRKLLELLGFMPDYTCGEPRAQFAGKLPGELDTTFMGATATLNASDPAKDVVTIVLPAAGASVGGHSFTGTLIVSTSGGTDRFELEVDARQAQIDGKTLPGLGGYGTCGDETRYWAELAGTLESGTTYRVDLMVAKRSGVPIIGGTHLLIDGSGSITRGGGTDTLTLTSVDYEVGKLLPASGTVVLVTSSGRRISATFNDDTPLAGRVSVKIDSKATVTIPLPGH